MKALNVRKKYGNSNAARITLTLFDLPDYSMTTFRIRREQLQSAVADYLYGANFKVARFYMMPTKTNVGEPEMFYLVRNHLTCYDGDPKTLVEVATTGKYDTVIIRSRPQMQDDHFIESLLGNFKPLSEFPPIILHNDDTAGSRIVTQVEALVNMQKDMGDTIDHKLYKQHTLMLFKVTEALFKYLPKYH